MKRLILVLIASFFFHLSFAQPYLEALNRLNNHFGKYYYGTALGHVQIDKGDFYFYYKGWGDAYMKVAMTQLANAVDDEELEMVKLYAVNKEYRIFSTAGSSTPNGIVHPDPNSFYMVFASEYKSDRQQLVTLLNDFVTSYNKSMGVNHAQANALNQTALVTPNCISGNCENGFGRYTYPDSSIYSGEWKDGKKSGKGRIEKKDGIVVAGNWNNDVFSGKGTVTYPERYPFAVGHNYYNAYGRSVYEGEIKNYLPDGEGILYICNSAYKNKTTLKGTFVNGLINGKGEYSNVLSDSKYDVQKETYVGNFKDGLYDGFGIYTLTSHYPKAKEKGRDNIETYEGDWKAGRKDGNGKYFCNYPGNRNKYSGQWKNGVQDGIGIQFGGAGEAKVEGVWREGNELHTKYSNSDGVVLYDGGKKERDLYWARIREADREREALAKQYYESSGQAARDRKEREDLAARIAATPKKECVCDKCSGSGKMSIRSAKIWYSDVMENGKKVGTATNSGWEYEDLKCTRCLGTGKCK